MRFLHGEKDSVLTRGGLSRSRQTVVTTKGTGVSISHSSSRSTERRAEPNHVQREDITIKPKVLPKTKET